MSPWESDHRPSSRSDSGGLRTDSTPANDVRWWRATRTPMSRPTSALGGESTGCHWLIRRISRTAASASSDTRGSCGRDQRCAPASRVAPFHLRAFWCVQYKLSGRWDLATGRVGLRRSFELTAARPVEEGIDKPPRALAPEGRRGGQVAVWLLGLPSCPRPSGRRGRFDVRTGGRYSTAIGRARVPKREASN